MKKACSKCGEIKPITEFSRDRRRADGHRANCKKCQAEQDRQYRQRKKSPRNNNSRVSADSAEWQREKEMLYAQLNGVQRQQAVERKEWERERDALKKARADFEGRIRRLRQQVTQLETECGMWQRKAHESEARRRSSSVDGDNGLKIFAAIVGLTETEDPAEIKKAFRKARATAHPDNASGRDWISARYNSAYDLFTELYK